MVTNMVLLAPAIGPGLSVKVGANNLHMVDRVHHAPAHSPHNPYPPWEQSVKDTQSSLLSAEHFREGTPKSRY